jgi:hypothetical protein
VDHALWRVDPASFRGEAGVGAHGAEDDAAGYLHVVNLLDDGIEHRVGILAAARGKAGGVGVAVDRGVVSEAVFLHDLAGVTPDEEVGFDFFAARVAADTALTGVAEEVWCEADFAASDNLVDVHVSSSGARHICPSYVNGHITSCQLTRFGGIRRVWTHRGPSDETLDEIHSFERRLDTCSERKTILRREDRIPHAKRKLVVRSSIKLPS